MAESSIKQQIVDKLKDSNNILVTVSSDPSVDELSAALGITLLLNKLGKHATAVFSGHVPPAISFLEPEKTFEDTVDSLRDFIIALDKEKADHLRYKVVDDMVKIFITPYRTTISEKDLDFSQGDYNVEMVLAIGVKTEKDLDKALESHGRILHDATVAAISLGEATQLGGLEWTANDSSSYSEMLVELADAMKTDKNLVDEQIATAFLTGIVAATERFSNNKTSSKVMTTAAQLMAAGANQQLIATKLQVSEPSASETATPTPPKTTTGDLKEGESAKVDRGSASSTPPAATEPTAPEPPKEEGLAADGSLVVGHPPEDAVDEARRLVAEKQSAEAFNEAKTELQTKATPVTADTSQAEQVEQAEQELAAELPSIAVTPALTPLSAVPTSDSSHSSPSSLGGPSIGGTLNATTEQAAADKQRELEKDRNRTILSHSSTGYVSEEPAFHTPLNAASAADTSEPSIPDILSQNSQAASVAQSIGAIQPPAPTVAPPTLAEIDAQARTQQEEALAAVNAAVAPSMTGVAPLTDATTPVDPSVDLPPMPALPPMPDFSTLPPLPSNPDTTPVPGTTLGDMLPPLASIGPIGSGPSEPGAADPAQFRIPGQ